MAYTNGVNGTHGNGVHDVQEQRRNIQTQSHGSSTETENGVVDVETEFLVVGCGPAGASLSCFLGSYGKPDQASRGA